MAYETVSLSTIRKNVFNTVSTFINASKSASWSVISAFPEQNPVFPCIIVNPATIEYQVKGMTRGIRTASASVYIEFYCPASDGKGAIDSEVDKICNAFLTGYTTLRTYNLVLVSSNPIEDAGSDELVFNQNKLNYAAITVNLMDP